jgi:hypothetical protein
VEGNEAAASAAEYAPPPPTHGGGIFGRVQLIVVGLVLLGAIGVGAYFVVTKVLSPAADIHDKMVPAEVDGYWSATLDPSPAQKLNLLGVVNKFPELKTLDQIDKKINELFDLGLKDSGLSYANDIKPWVGKQASFAFQLEGGAPSFSATTYTALVASKDDSKAKTFMDKIRSSGKGKSVSWSSHTHDGVTVWGGNYDPGSSHSELDYALVDGTVVFGSTGQSVDVVIDTARNRHSSLHNQALYKTTLAHLPADRLVVGYLNAPALVKDFKDAIGQSTSSSSSSPFNSQALKTLDAYNQFGMAVSAGSGSIHSDFWVGVDKQKLPPDARQQYAQATHPNSLIADVPQDTVGLIAFTGVKSTVKQIDQLASNAGPEIQQSLDELGVSSSGALSHLTDDFAILEGRPGAGEKFPGSALLLGTDDPAGTGAFLKKLVDTLVPLLTQSTASSQGQLSQQFQTQPAPGQSSDQFTVISPPVGAPAQAAKPLFPPRPPRPQTQLLTESYKGVTIHYLALASIEEIFPGLSPAYAVSGNLVIIASSRTEVKEVIDTQKGAPRISSASGYQAAVQESLNTSGGIAYFDIAGIAGIARDLLQGEARIAYDRDVARWIDPLRLFAISAQVQNSGVMERFVLLVK